VRGRLPHLLALLRRIYTYPLLIWLALTLAAAPVYAQPDNLGVDSMEVLRPDSGGVSEVDSGRPADEGPSMENMEERPFDARELEDTGGLTPLTPDAGLNVEEIINGNNGQTAPRQDLPTSPGTGFVAPPVTVAPSQAAPVQARPTVAAPLQLPHPSTSGWSITPSTIGATRQLYTEPIPIIPPTPENYEGITRGVSLFENMMTIDETALHNEANRRLKIGREFYTLGFWSTAIAYFHSITTEKNLEHFPETYEARYLESESYLRHGIPAQATKGYEWIIEQGKRKPHYFEALTRLVEINLTEEGHPEQAELYYEMLLRASKDPELTSRAHYLFATFWMDKSKLGKALDYFSKVKLSTRVGLRASYMIGAIASGTDNPEEAVRHFVAVEKAGADLDDSDSSEIVNMARLATARIFYDAADYARSFSFFKRVTHHSASHPAALFEGALALFKAKQHTLALRNLSELVINYPHNRLTVDAKNLAGYIYLEYRDYERAWTSFNKFVTEYAIVKERMLDFTNQGRDPVEFYRDLTSLTTPGAENGLPPILGTWIAERRRLEASEQLIDSVSELKREIEETRRFLTRLKMSTWRPTFDVDAEYLDYERRGEVEDHIQMVRSTLLGLQLKPLVPHLFPQEKKIVYLTRRFREYLIELKELPPVYDTQSIAKKAEIQALSRYVYSIYPELYSKIVVDNEQRLGQEPPEEQRVVSFPDPLTALRKFDEQVSDLQVLEDGVRSDVNNLRRWIDLTLEIEAVILVDTVERYDLKSKSPFYVKAFAFYQRASELQKSLKALNAQMDSIWSNLVEEISRKAELEARDLEGYEEIYSQIDDTSNELRGYIAMDGFNQLTQELEHQIVKGNLGFIDTSWKIREEERQKMSSLRTYRGERLTSLTDYYDRIKAREVQQLSDPPKPKKQQRLERRIRTSPYGREINDLNTDLLDLMSRLQHAESVLSNLNSGTSNESTLIDSDSADPAEMIDIEEFDEEDLDEEDKTKMPRLTHEELGDQVVNPTDAPRQLEPLPPTMSDYPVDAPLDSSAPAAAPEAPAPSPMEDAPAAEAPVFEAIPEQPAVVAPVFETPAAPTPAPEPIVPPALQPVAPEPVPPPQFEAPAPTPEPEPIAPEPAPAPAPATPSGGFEEMVINPEELEAGTPGGAAEEIEAITPQFESMPIE
jgi:tetratricopeptide (TPR) repeat protein